MSDLEKCYLKCDVENPTRCETVCTAENSLSVLHYVLIVYLLFNASVMMFVVYKYRAQVFYLLWLFMTHFFFLVLSLLQFLYRSAIGRLRMRTLLEGTALTQESVQAIHLSASTARDRLREVIRLVSENELESVLFSIHQSEYLRESTLKTMAERQTSRVQGIVGTSMQLGGIVFMSNPFAWGALVVGAILTALSDKEIENQTKTIRNHENQTMEIFDRESRRFRNLESALREFDRAIRVLNENFVRYVGRSIYDPSFRDFVLYQVFGADPSQDIATANRDHIGALTYRPFRTGQRLDRNQLEVIRDSEVVPLVKYVARFMESEEMALARTVVFSATAMTPIPGASYWKGGELAARCITMYKEFKEDKITITQLNNGIQDMRTQYSTMVQMHDALNERGLRG